MAISKSKKVFMAVSASQVRGARGMLGWSQEELADAAGLSRGAIRQLEAGASDARISTLSAVQSALEKAGVEFTNGGEPGVKLRAKRKAAR